MLELEPEYLTVRAEACHPEAVAGVRFQRALRLPAGRPPYESVRSDAFHLPRPLNDHFEDLDFDWLLRSNQCVICLTPSESVTMEFAAPSAYPFAVMVSIGRHDALTGKPADGTLARTPQNYLSLTCQNWLDSWLNADGEAHDFVTPWTAPPEAAALPAPAVDESDCISISFVPMKADAFQRRCQDIDQNAGRQVYGAPDFAERFSETHMLSGRMRYEMQQGDAWDAGIVYPDPFDANEWDIDHAALIAVTMVGPTAWQALTGEVADPALFGPDIYEQAGVPWDASYADET